MFGKKKRSTICALIGEGMTVLCKLSLIRGLRIDGEAAPQPMNAAEKPSLKLAASNPR